MQKIVILKLKPKAIVEIFKLMYITVELLTGHVKSFRQLIYQISKTF